MRTINIYDYFPIQDDAGMKKFLQKDSDFEERKQQFFSVLIPTITSEKKKFGHSLISGVFSLSYIMGHRWPNVT